MVQYSDSLKTARRSIQIADHMLTQTYPLIKDPKLLLAVLDNIFISMSSSMDALLFYERELKRIPPFHNGFESKFDILKLKLAGQNGIDPSYLTLMMDVKILISKHKNSPVEFARKDKFVICSKEYTLTSISVDQIKGFVTNARQFFDIINKRIGDDID